MQLSHACAAGLLAMAATCTAVAAESFPAKPVRLIVPFPAGGGGDSAARLLVQELSMRIGQQVVVDNRGGAGGLIGMEIVKNALPDGYTVLLSTAGFVAMPALHKRLPFDPARDFTGVITALSGAYILVVHPGSPFKSVTALIAYAKANPGKLDYASAGNGSTIHLAGELFKNMAQINWVHVPYKGAGPALTDVIGRQVKSMFASATNGLPMIKSGKLRALAVTSAKRSSLARELPTIAESGLPGFEVTGWYGIAAPVQTPRFIVARLNAEVNHVLRLPELAERLPAQGLEIVGGIADAATALIKGDVARWISVLRDAGLKQE